MNLTTQEYIPIIYILHVILMKREDYYEHNILKNE